MRQRKPLPFSPQERIAADRRMRDAVRVMCQGLKSRPEPRATFDNILEHRSAPWAPMLTLIFAAVKAGQRRENVRALGLALVEIADMQYPPEPEEACPIAALVAEAEDDAEADRVQAMALALRTPEAYEAAGHKTLRFAERALRTAHVLLFHAGRPSRTRTPSRAA